MPTTITSPVPNEEGTAIVGATFTDENGDSHIPTSVSWTLTDINGNVINSRQDVSETPAATVSITLSGDDLAIPIKNNLTRVFTLHRVYNSSAGTGLTENNQMIFSINDLVAV